MQPEASNPRSSLDGAVVSSAVLAKPAQASAGPRSSSMLDHYTSWPSGPISSIDVHATIPEATILSSHVASSVSSLPALCHSPTHSASPTGSCGSFPSPVFLRGREPSIASNHSPQTITSLRSWKRWKHDASLEFERSFASWKDTPYSLEEMARTFFLLLFSPIPYDFHV